jgi:hypothetical protein
MSLPMSLPRPLPLPHPAAGTDVIEMLRSAASGVFPGPVLEALIARMEAGK